jgi:hypothetical protein
MKVAFLLTLFADEPRSLRETMDAHLGLRWRIRLNDAETGITRGALVNVDCEHRNEKPPSTAGAIQVER